MTSTLGQVSVSQFQMMLEDADRELFIDTVENATSPIEVWTLATVMGYTGTMGDLIAWANERYPRTDRRRVLLEEADKLKEDIADARALIQMGTLDLSLIHISEPTRPY